MVAMKKIISTPNAPAPIGPFSQATAFNGVLYVSGQLPVDAATGEVCTGSIGEQTTLVMNNIKAIVDAAGATMADVLKCTILLTDMADFAAVNEAYGAFFSDDPPARICYQVSALPRSVDVEVDAMVALN
jgi:2-iminobutanoate/2-iminopropanoate deaminase